VQREICHVNEPLIQEVNRKQSWKMTSNNIVMQEDMVAIFTLNDG